MRLDAIPNTSIILLECLQAKVLLFMKGIKHLLIVPCLLIFSGCATTSDIKDPTDPYESFNRTSYQFNKAIDDVALRPLAKGYDAVFPGPMKVGISNFFSNLEEVPTTVNSVLQGKFADALSDLGRFIINTTLGLAGFMDVATDLGLEKHDEDFGQTLGVWGVSSGPYLVLPFLGPSTMRDVVGKPLDSTYSLQNDIDHIPTKNSIYFMELIDLRYRLLALDSQLEDAIDEYSFVRDAFMMRLEYKVYDGNPPEDEDFYDDFDDEDCDEESAEDCEFEIID